jgi:hypothetical protein
VGSFLQQALFKLTIIALHTLEEGEHGDCLCACLVDLWQCVQRLVIWKREEILRCFTRVHKTQQVVVHHHTRQRGAYVFILRAKGLRVRLNYIGGKPQGPERANL